MTLLGCNSDWATVWTVGIRFLANGFFLPPTPTPPLGLIILPPSGYLGCLPGVSWPERSAYDLLPSRIQVTNACHVPSEVEVVDQKQ